MYFHVFLFQRLGWAVFTRSSNLSEVKRALDRTKVNEYELRVSIQDVSDVKLVCVHVCITVLCCAWVCVWGELG